MVTSEEFRAEVLAADATKFVKHRLFDGTCWLFDQPHLLAPEATYQRLRRDLADEVDANLNEINFVGSAKFGFSMAPQKAWRPFNPDGSDLDCAIISSKLFSECLRQLRNAFFEGYTHYSGLHAGQVFAGHIVLSTTENYRSNYLNDLSRRIIGLQKVTQNHLRFEPDVNYRIYESFDAAERYHIEGVKRLQSHEDSDDD